jgi:hypothetical protein
MAHIQARRYLGGWWPAGAKEEAPDGTLRRNRGVRRFMEGQIRSRLGTSLVQAVDAHSIVRYRDQRYYGVGTTFMREGTVIRTGLSGTPLSFAKMPTSDGQEDSLFVTGGGVDMFRVDPSGVVSTWGITAPPDGFIAAVANIGPPPDTMAVAVGGAGNLYGELTYRVAFVNDAGVIGPLNRTSLVSPSFAGNVGELTNIPTWPAPVAQRVIVKTRPDWATYYQVTTIPDNTTTTYTDNIPDSSLTITFKENMVGVYQYHVTFKNTTTGSRSNPNPTPYYASNSPVQLVHEVYLSNLPISSQPGVDAREIWRTVGNGNIFFLCAVIPNNTQTTYTDNLADVNLEEEELPDDNNSPAVEFNHLQGVAGPHSTRLWWRSNKPGERGKLFFSPVARPEGVEDFIFVSNDDDPIQAHVQWGPSMFVFTEARLYEVLGDGPFTARDVPEAPGTMKGRTVVPTPFGIFYQAQDGVRLFNGQNSRLIGFDAVGPLFHGEALEGVAAFEGEVAAYYENEYLISNGVETLGLDIARIVWRVLGYGCRAFHMEADTNALLGTVAGKVVALEAEGTTSDSAGPITFEVEWPHVLVGVVYPGFLQFLNILVDTTNQPLTPTLILDGVERTLPTLTTSGRTRVEWPIGRSCRMAGLRLTGYLTQPVTIWALDGEFYAGAPDASVTAGAAAAR